MSSPAYFAKRSTKTQPNPVFFFLRIRGADATIGGMIANNASGVQTIKYGATKDYVMRLVVVLPRRQSDPYRRKSAQIFFRVRPYAAFWWDPRERWAW